MAEKKKGGLAAIHRQYDKIIAVLVLIGLLATLLFLINSSKMSQREGAAFDRAIAALTPAHPQTEPVTAERYEAAQLAIATPFQMQPATNKPFLVAQERVWCVGCRRPISFEAEVCPQCGVEQPGSVTPEDWDSDGDGMPDAWERKYGLNPLDPADASGDLDGDGFTNLEEFQANTDPTDPASHPPRIDFLRVKTVSAVPFPLVLRGSVRGREGKISYQLNDAISKQTFYVTVGDKVGATGYSVVEGSTKKVQRAQPGFPEPREVEIHVVTLEREGKRVVLEQDAPRTATDYEIVFICQKDRVETTYTARLGERFVFDKEEYQVKTIDNAGRYVVIHSSTKRTDLEIPAL